MDIILKDVEYCYQKNTPFERLAIYDINIEIPSKSYVAIIGHTGSGKSTILQHLNGLLQPTKGLVKIGEKVIQAGKKQKALKEVRKRVGIVFQFPEHQLFEETVEKDICFGPMNFGASLEEAKAKARWALNQVGLSEDILSKSPFDLSGGQMRRVAIAGVLAMEPEVLVLDEPTAGLDPKGRLEIMEMFYRLHRQNEISTVLVTHSMEDAALYADRIIVMDKGTVIKQGTPEQIFSSSDQLFDLGLDVPVSIRIQQKLKQKLAFASEKPCLTLNELVEATVQALKRGNQE